MPIYRVTQTIEINSPDATTAVIEARLHQLDPSDNDRDFTVVNVRQGKKSTKFINLNDLSVKSLAAKFKQACRDLY